MRHFIFPIMVVLIFGLISSCSSPGFELPDEWTHDFTIDLFSGGGMQDRSTTITFTYDSCKYVDHKGSDNKIIAFAMTAADRMEVLKKMHELNADKIRSIKDSNITLDKESTSVCFQYKMEFCLVDGPASEIVKEDGRRFSDVYRYLTSFAIGKK